MLDSPRFPSFTSLVDLLHHRAAKQPDDRAYIFLSDQGNEEAVLTFADLARGAGEVAARLAHSQIGDRALLLFGDGKWATGPVGDTIHAESLSALYQTPMMEVRQDDRRIFVPR